LSTSCDPKDYEGKTSGWRFKLPCFFVCAACAWTRLTPGSAADSIPRSMRQRGVAVAVLCGALLAGVFAAPSLHMHAAVEHQHGVQDRHHHESLLHVHVPDGRDSDADQHVGDHAHSDATVIVLTCRLVRTKVLGAAPGMIADALRAPQDPARWSSLDPTLADHPRGALYLFGPSLRGPPA